MATVLDELYDETFAGASEFMNRTTQRDAALGQAFAHLWSLWRQHRPLMMAVLDARAGDREAAEIWGRWLERFVAPVAEVITADREAGLAPSGPGPAVLTRMLVSMNERSLEQMLRADLTEDEVAEELHALRTIWTRSIYGVVPAADHLHDLTVVCDGKEYF